VDHDGGDDLGGAAAGADQLGAVVAVGAGWRLEHHVAVAEDTAQLTFGHGWLLSRLLVTAGWIYPNVIQTLPRNPGIAEH
jgi:hypothetical protein